MTVKPDNSKTTFEVPGPKEGVLALKVKNTNMNMSMAAYNWVCCLGDNGSDFPLTSAKLQTPMNVSMPTVNDFPNSDLRENYRVNFAPGMVNTFKCSLFSNWPQGSTNSVIECNVMLASHVAYLNFMNGGNHNLIIAVGLVAPYILWKGLKK